MSSMRSDLLDRFEYWLADMDDGIARLRSRLPDEVQANLDLSPESLSVLEAWLLARFPSVQHVLAPEALEEVDGVARYIGETFRRAIGGRWDANVDDPKNVFYGLPLLTGFSEKPTPISPHALVSAAAERRTGSFLRTVLDSSMKRLGR